MSAPIKDGGIPFHWMDAFKAGEWQAVALRDYFAGQALTGLIAMQANPAVGTKVDAPEFSKPHACKEFAEAAYNLADAMLAARSKSP